MSSIFSDPFFRRGSTLLSGELIEYSDLAQTIPVAGTEVVGQVKAFQDVNPVGAGERWSNRLVYCVAARYIGNDTTGANLKGQLVVFTDTAPLTAFGVSGSPNTAARASVANIAAGRSYGVVDEYLADTLDVRKNDIVWVVVKGPTTVAKAPGTAIDAGVGVFASTTAGAVTASGATGAGTVSVGENIAGAQAVAGATTVRVNLHNDII